MGRTTSQLSLGTISPLWVDTTPADFFHAIFLTLLTCVLLSVVIYHVIDLRLECDGEQAPRLEHNN